MTHALATPAEAPIPLNAVQADHWSCRLAKLERLLAIASDHLGEDIPYVGPAIAGVDRVEALLDGAASLVRELAKELGRAEAPSAL